MAPKPPFVVCVCVCVREREREKKRKREREVPWSLFSEFHHILTSLVYFITQVKKKKDFNVPSKAYLSCKSKKSVNYLLNLCESYINLMRHI